MISTWISRVSVFLATGCCVGFFPFMPGTVGTLIAYPLYRLARLWLLPLPLIAAAAVAFVVSIPICQRAANALRHRDPSEIVLDEIVAMFLILCLTPETLYWQVAAFLIFRLFDIFKPFPIGWLDHRLDGGFGIMLDDLLAAFFTVLLLFVAQALFLP